MNTSIYRFRSIDKVLASEDLEGSREGYDELRKQQIYFASLKELNDPMEGYKEIYWQGDEIVWKNLLKHYLLCLEHVYCLMTIGGEEYKISASDIPIFKKLSDLPTEEYKNLLTSICKLFFSHQTISQYPELLSQRQSPVRKKELLNLLTQLHIYAINVINNIYQNNFSHGLLPKQSELTHYEKSFPKEDYFDNLHRAEQEHGDKSYNLTNVLFSAFIEIHEEHRLILQYNNRNKMGKNKSFLLLDFPNIYLKQIEQLLYPDCSIACFSKSYKNASMWSHYAGNHEGICFQFKTNNLKHFNLIKNPISNHKTPYELHPLKYQKNFPEMNFFESLGRLPIPHLIEVWLTGEEKQQSSCSKFLNNKNEEEWRQEYWKRYYDTLNTKTLDWKYEDECRIIRYSTIGEKIQLTNYDFDDLEGIIFGINTKTEHKIKIMEIIEEKCKKTSRKDFQFYQADYCPNEGGIKKRKLTSLKFK